MIVQGYIISILYVLLCVAGAIALHKLGIPKKYTRKFVHIFVGFEWVILNHFMGGGIHFLAVCILFTVLLAIDYKVKLLPAMSSDGDNAPGTVYYAVAMTVLAVAAMLDPQMMIPFGVAVFCTSFGDGFAGVFGQLVKKHNPKIYGSKSLVGTIVNVAVCFAVPLVIGFLYSYPIAVWQAAVIAIFAAEIELFVGKGLDNLILTLSIAALTFGIVNFPWLSDYLLPILLTPAIIALSYTKRALTLGGIIAAVFMDIAISLSLKNFGFAVLALFFVGSVIVDKIKKLATEIYRASNVEIDSAALRKIKMFEEQGYGNLPICVAKTQNSISHDPKLINAPKDFTFPVRDVQLYAGAGFIVVLAGDIMTMPGLPKVPAAMNIDVDDEGKITGLF